MSETWLPVPGYEGRYEVSSLGGIRSLGWMRHDGRHPIKPRVLTPFVDVTSTGYLYANLCIDGRAKKIAVHTLVLLAFVGPRPAGTVCCHGDGNRANPRLENLRWDTYKGNSADSIRHGTSARGERAGAAKLNREQVEAILCDPRSSLQLAPILGVASSTIRAVRIGQNWSHATGIK